MLERAHRSWDLMREAWEVLRQDRALIVFPILSGIFSLLAMASFAVPFFLLGLWREMTQGAGAAHPQTGPSSIDPWYYLLTFLSYLVTYFIVVYFNSGLVACVRMRLAGERATVKDGFAFANANVGRIFAWALLSATVGVILRAVEERAGWLGQIIIGLLGLAWSLATVFVVPVLVHERVGPFEAVKRSAQAFRRTWGEAVVANIGLGIAFTLLFLPALAVLILGVAASVWLASMSASMAALVFGGTVIAVLVYWIGLAIVQTTLNSIFLTACYQYATTGHVPTAFSPEYVTQAWRPKKR